MKVVQIIIFYFLMTMSVFAQEAELILQRGHSQYISFFRVSPSGEHIISVGSWMDKTIKLWERETGKLLRTFGKHQVAITDVAFSEDGKYLASTTAYGTETGAVRVWEIATGKMLWLYENSLTNPAYSVAFSPDGKYLAYGGETDSYLLNVKTGKKLHTFKGGYDNLGSQIKDVQFSSNGKYLLTKGLAMTLWDVDVQKNVWKEDLDKRPAYLKKTAISSDGRYIAGIAYPDLVQLIDTKTNQRKVYFKDSLQVNFLQFSKDNRFLFSGDKVGEFRVWKMPEVKLVKQLYAHDFKDDKKLLALKEVELRNEIILRQLKKKKEVKNYLSDVLVSISSDGRYMASHNHTKSLVKIWDIFQHKNIATVNSNVKKITQIKISENGQDLLILSQKDQKIELWNIATEQLVKNIQLDKEDYISQLKLSNDNEYIVGLGEKCKIWHRSGKHMKTFKYQPNRVVGLSADSKYLATTAQDQKNVVQLYKIKGKKLKSDKKLDLPVYTIPADLSFSADNQWLMVRGGQSSSVLYDLRDEQTSSIGAFGDLVMSRDGKYAATGGKGSNNIFIWQHSTDEGWQQIKELEGHNNEIAELNFTPNNQYLLSQSSDQIVNIWDWKASDIIVTIHPIDIDNYVITTPKGRFDAPKKAHQYIRYWQNNRQLNQSKNADLRKKHHQKGLLEMILNSESSEAN